MKALTPKQERFVHEYLIDQNASAAAGRAGYSLKTRGAQAAELMKLPQVKGRILQELADLYARLKVNALDLLRLQVAAAYFDPASLFDEAQEPVPLRQLDDQTRRALTVSYDRRRNGEYVMRVKQTPRHVAVAALNRRFEQFERLREEFDARQAWEEEREQTREPKRAAPRARVVRPADIVLDVHTAPSLRPVAPAAAMEAAHAEVAAAAEAIERSASEMQARREVTAQAPAPGTPPVRLSVLAQTLAELRAADARPKETNAVGVLPQAVAGAAPVASAPAQEEAYDFRKDPNWMWGGRYRRNPVPPQEEPSPEQIAAAVAAARLHPSKVIAPMQHPPGYNPPWLRDDRPQYAIGAGEFHWS